MYYMTQITVRDVDKDVFREFKADAMRQGLTIGGALNIAMEKFRTQLGNKRKFTSLKPVDWGKGTEHLSEEVDKVLYGD